MSGVVERLRSRLWPSASVLALAIGVAGCSGDTTRFNENPYAKSNPEATGSTQQAAPAGHVESRPLPPQTAQQPAPAARPTNVATGAGTVGGAAGMSSYRPPAATA